MKKLVSALLVVVMVLALGAAAFADAGITVTKNPTNESRVAGETAWFVANAQNYKTLEWTFVDTLGREYTALQFVTAFPMVKLEGENTANLTVRNLVMDLNGWSVFCNFRNDDYTAITERAYFNVAPHAVAKPAATIPAATIPANNTASTYYVIYDYVDPYYYGYNYGYDYGYDYGYVDPYQYSYDGYDPSAPASGYVDEYLYGYDGYDYTAPFYGYDEDDLLELYALAYGTQKPASGYVDEELYWLDGFDPSAF